MRHASEMSILSLKVWLWLAYSTYDTFGTIFDTFPALNIFNRTLFNWGINAHKHTGEAPCPRLISN